MFDDRRRNEAISVSVSSETDFLFEISVASFRISFEVLLGENDEDDVVVVDGDDKIRSIAFAVNSASRSVVEFVLVSNHGSSPDDDGDDEEEATLTFVKVFDGVDLWWVDSV